MCAGCRFESHGANGAFVEDFTVGSLNVRLESSNISEDDATVYTATAETEEESVSHKKRQLPFNAASIKREWQNNSSK